MIRLKFKEDIKSVVFCLFKVLLIVCVIFGAIKGIPIFFEPESIPEKPMPVPVNNKLMPGEKGSIEFLATGNSCLYSALNPLQLWQEYGIASYIAASPKQNMCVSYQMLKEILTVQSPKVIMLEVNNFFDNRGVDDVETNSNITYKNCFQIFNHTNRWSEMVEKHFVQSRVQNNKLLTHGYYYSQAVVPYYFGMSYMKF